MSEFLFLFCFQNNMSENEWKCGWGRLMVSGAGLQGLMVDT